MKTGRMGIACVMICLVVSSLAVSSVAAQGQGVRTNGQIISIELAQDSFVLEAGDQQYTIYVNQDTQYLSSDNSITGLADLQVGMQVYVMAFTQNDGSLLATHIGYQGTQTGATPNLVRASGLIQAVSVDATGSGTVSLAANTGETLEFVTDASTEVRSLDDSVATVADLQIGMSAVIVGTSTEGVNTARLIVASDLNGRDPEELINTEVRVLGAIIALGSNSIGIQTLQGEQYQFEVNANTVFRSEDGTVNSFADLQIGMFVMVGANGSLAEWVAAKPLAAEGDDPVVEPTPTEQPPEQGTPTPQAPPTEGRNQGRNTTGNENIPTAPPVPNGDSGQNQSNDGQSWQGYFQNFPGMNGSNDNGGGGFFGSGQFGGNFLQNILGNR